MKLCKHYHSILISLPHDTPSINGQDFRTSWVVGQPLPECQTILSSAAARDDGSGGSDNRNSKTYKAPVKSAPTHTNTQRMLLKMFKNRYSIP